MPNALMRFFAMPCLGFIVWGGLLAFSGIASAAASLDALLKQALIGTKTPAVAALVIRDGKIAEQAVLGVRRNDGDKAATNSDRWLLGSASKPMTAALIAKLVERGLLSWKAPLEKMLPELAATMHPDYRQVTLLQLLSHTSGLPENLGDTVVLDGFYADTRPFPEQRWLYIAAALKEAPTVKPGTEFSYCNTGFLIAGVIAERASKTDFEVLMQREVFAPLAMTSARFGANPAGQPQGHRGGKPVGKALKNEDGVPDMFSPAGYMRMSLQDWAKFCLDQLAGGRGQGKLLNVASYTSMQTAQAKSIAGLAWNVQDGIAGRQGPVLVHGGSDGNNLAWVVLFPKTNNGVVVVANAAEDMGGEQATFAVLGALFPSLSPAKE
jgi:CubicO group peptidase (beta-lactamase class C family)